MNELLLPYANDNNGNLVHIYNAQKGHKYSCPHCDAELSLRISRIPEGQKYHKRNHFAHKGLLGEHCSESVLHKLFKDKCAEFIQEKINSKQDWFYEWHCERCNEVHKENLLTAVVDVDTEYNLGRCRPDIALLDNQGKVVVAIEVIVTHKPESKISQYYEDNEITCLQIKVNDFLDCEVIESKLSHPDNVNICLCRNNEIQLEYLVKPNDTLLIRFLKNIVNTTNCPKCKGRLQIEENWCGGLILRCENYPECEYEKKESDFDSEIFPLYR